MASTSAELFAAISDTHVDRVRALLSADPSLATARDEHGVSALMQARYRFDRGLVEVVKTHVPELDVFESSALGDHDRLVMLLDGEPSAVAERSGDGFTPLHLAAFFGQVETVALLIGRGAEVDAPGTGWMTGTPLHSAAAGHHRDVARLLLKAGADPNARQAGGFTPLHSAAHNGDATIARLLLEAGADPALTTDDGTNALTSAEGSGDAATIDAVRQATA